MPAWVSTTYHKIHADNHPNKSSQFWNHFFDVQQRCGLLTSCRLHQVCKQYPWWNITETLWLESMGSPTSHAGYAHSRVFFQAHSGIADQPIRTSRLGVTAQVIHSGATMMHDILEILHDGAENLLALCPLWTIPKVNGLMDFADAPWPRIKACPGAWCFSWTLTFSVKASQVEELAPCIFAFKDCYIEVFCRCVSTVLQLQSLHFLLPTFHSPVAVKFPSAFVQRWMVSPPDHLTNVWRMYTGWNMSKSQGQQTIWHTSHVRRRQKLWPGLVISP